MEMIPPCFLMRLYVKKGKFVLNALQTKLIIFIIFLLTFLLTPTFLLAKEREKRVVRVISVPKDEIIEQDFYIKSGEVIEISGKVKGDAILVGGEIRVDGEVDGDLLVLGGTVYLSGKVSQDVRIIAGQIDVSGEVGRNLSIVGANIELGKSASLAKGVAIVGGSLFLQTSVPGDVDILVGNFTLAGELRGETKVRTANLRLTSESKISGNLVYTSENDLVIDKGASISGKIAKQPLSSPFSFSRNQFIYNFSKKLGIFKIYLKILSFLSSLIIGLLIIRFMPNCVKNIALSADKKMLKTFTVGFIAILAFPLTALFLSFTIIGIPLAFIVFFIYLIFIYLTNIYFSFWLGAKFKGVIKLESEYILFLLAISLYYLAISIPLIGFLVGLYTLFFGMGMIILGYADFYKKAKKSKII